MSEQTYNEAINTIKTAVYGEEVRDAIIEALNTSYEDIKLSGGDAELVDIRNEFIGGTADKAGDAVRRLGKKGTVEAITKYKNGRVLIYPESNRGLRYLDDNFTYEESSSAYVSPIVCVNGFDKIKAVADLTGGVGWVYLAYFDKDFNFLENESKVATESENIISSGTVLDIPQDAWYMFGMATSVNTTINGLFYIYNQEEEEAEAEAEENLFPLIGKVKITPPYELSGYIHLDDGHAASVDSKSTHTKLISVNGFNKYECVSMITNPGAAVAFYDSNYKYLNELAVPGDSTTNVISGDIPEAAAYIATSYFNSSSGSNDYLLDSMYLMIWNEDQFPNSIEGKLQAQINNIESKNDALDGANILIFGDSITDSTTINIDSATNRTTGYSWDNPSNSDDNGGYNMWPKLINDNYNVNEIRCYAKSGAHYANFAYEGGEANHRQLMQYQIDVAFNDLSNPNGVFKVTDFVPDIVIFACGTNDGANGSGSYDATMAKTVYESDGKTIDVDATISALDPTNFNDALRLAYLRVKNKFPLAQLYVVIPIQRTSDERIFSKTNEDIRKMAQRYGAIIVDGAAEFGIIPEGNVSSNSGETLKDGLHPNKNGQLLYARGVIKSIESHYLPLNSLKNYEG